MKLEEILPLMREGRMVKRPNMQYAITVKDGIIKEYRASRVYKHEGYWDERTVLTSLQILADDWEVVEESEECLIGN